ncbi:MULTISPECIES: ABC transporter ATP-binding protein [unclassified Blastococcus]
MTEQLTRRDLAIEISQVSKTFRTRKGVVDAVSSVSLAIEEGSFVSLLGPSGCGKSTLLKMVLGLEEPTAGTVSVSGQPVGAARRDVGMMLQTPALVPWRTVRDNVLLPVDLLGGARRRDHRARVDELLAMVGLTAFAGSYPRELSGGMQQRAALCRALLFDPAILILDEPFGALDHITREQLNDEMLRICAGGEKTVLLVTHDIDEAVYMSDRVVVMSARPGRVNEVLEVGLPHPRTLTTRKDPRFETNALRIRELLGIGSIT